MKTPTPTRTLLKEREDLLIRELRRIAPKQTQDLVEVQAALSGLLDLSRDQLSEEYSRFRKGIDAIEHWLTERQTPMSRQVIAKEIEEGGFARGEDTRPYWNLLDTMKYHLASTGRIVEKNSKIGLPEWEDARYA